MDTTEPTQGYLAIDGELTICAEIDSVDQLLLVAAKCHALATGKQLRLPGHTQPVLDMLDLCRPGSFFGDQVPLSDFK